MARKARPPQRPTRRELITAIITSRSPRDWSGHELAMRLQVKPRSMLTQLGECRRIGFFTRTGFEADREGWAGHAEGLKISLAGAEDKVAQIDRRTRTAAPVGLGMPALNRNPPPNSGINLLLSYGVPGLAAIMWLLPIFLARRCGSGLAQQQARLKRTVMPPGGKPSQVLRCGHLASPVVRWCRSAEANCCRAARCVYPAACISWTRRMTPETRSTTIMIAKILNTARQNSTDAIASTTMTGSRDWRF